MPGTLAQIGVRCDNTGQEDNHVPAFPFKYILLHEIPDGKGWFIMGMKTNGTQESLAMLTPLVDREEVERLANTLAKKLSGTIAAKVD